MRNLLFVFAVILAPAAFAHKVTAVSTGDTLTLLVDNKPLKLHLAGIAAPDLRQSFGHASRRSLAELCIGKDATYEFIETDHHGSANAVIVCGDSHVNHVQLERGFAWARKNYERDLSLPGIELKARQRGAGLWADSNPVPPWEYQRPMRKTAARLPNQSDDRICFVGPRGREYRIVEGQKRYGC